MCFISLLLFCLIFVALFIVPFCMLFVITLNRKFKIYFVILPERFYTFMQGYLYIYTLQKCNVKKCLIRSLTFLPVVVLEGFKVCVINNSSISIIDGYVNNVPALIYKINARTR
jgi:hypothetical protein